MDNMAIIVRNVTKKFGNVTVLDNVSLQVKKGTICGIIGRNGSGKTVLFKCICGLLQIHDGSIPVDKKEIGAIIEEPGFLKQYSGKQNLRLLASMSGKENIDIEKALKVVGLECAGRKKVGKYSMGMRQRLGIAQAIMENQSILILDEPTAGLDPAGRDKILNCIENLHKKKGMAVVLVSHSMEDVANYAERIIVMNNGSVMFDDTPKKVFKHYKELEKIGLAAPQITYIMHQLKENGLDVDENIINVEEAKENILKALGK